VVLSEKLVKAQEGEFLASIVEQTQVKPEREKFRSEGLFKRKRIDDLNSWEGVNLQAQVEPGCYRISAYRGWRVQELHARRYRGSDSSFRGSVDFRRNTWHVNLGTSGLGS
jgi:hypothetical protein